MKKICGVLTDKSSKSGRLVLSTYGYLGFWYSSDIHNGTSVKLNLNELPKFQYVYDFFMSRRFFGLKLDKSQDICLSLFFNPYFDEFCEYMEGNICTISMSRLRFLVKHFFQPLADTAQYKLIVEDDAVEDKFLRSWYLQKNIQTRSLKLIELIKTRFYEENK
jgi:hypothetical protein